MTRARAGLCVFCQNPVHPVYSSGENGDVDQLCQFVGGEGGPGKSRVIEALVELFTKKGVSNRLLITATSGTAAARINGITIHSACGFSKDQGTGVDKAKDLDRVRLPKQAGAICPRPVANGLAGQGRASHRRDFYHHNRHDRHDPRERRDSRDDCYRLYSDCSPIQNRSSPSNTYPRRGSDYWNDLGRPRDRDRDRDIPLTPPREPSYRSPSMGTPTKPGKASGQALGIQNTPQADADAPPTARDASINSLMNLICEKVFWMQKREEAEKRLAKLQANYTRSDHRKYILNQTTTLDTLTAQISSLQSLVSENPLNKIKQLLDDVSAIQKRLNKDNTSADCNPITEEKVYEMLKLELANAVEKLSDSNPMTEEKVCKILRPELADAVDKLLQQHTASTESYGMTEEKVHEILKPELASIVEKLSKKETVSTGLNSMSEETVRETLRPEIANAVKSLLKQDTGGAGLNAMTEDKVREILKLELVSAANELQEIFGECLSVVADRLGEFLD
ncbi:hypothetical protein AUP68_00603 [Ilyonectria robusta]